jgi:selenocysteine-specific elongation factor
MRVLGTAGHVDHGKSSLVRALTGIDPDRLKEEKSARHDHRSGLCLD